MRLIAILLYLLLCLKPLNAEVRIAVIDTGFSKVSKYKKCVPDTTISGPVGDSYLDHGNLVVEALVKNLKIDYCLILIDVADEKGSITIADTMYAYNLVIKHNAHYVNLSYSGKTSFFLEERLIKKMLNNNITVVAAAGNDSLVGKCSRFPACYDERIIIASDNQHEKANKFINVDYYISGWFKDTWGTSYSAPKVLAYLANKGTKK